VEDCRHTSAQKKGRASVRYGTSSFEVGVEMEINNKELQLVSGYLIKHDYDTYMRKYLLLSKKLHLTPDTRQIESLKAEIMALVDMNQFGLYKEVVRAKHEQHARTISMVKEFQNERRELWLRQAKFTQTTRLTEEESFKGKLLQLTPKDNSKFYKIVFRTRNDRKSLIAIEVGRRAQVFHTFQNDFENDDSQNHVAIFDGHQQRDIDLLHHLIQTTGNWFGLWGYSIFGVGVEFLTNQCQLGIRMPNFCTTVGVRMDTDPVINQAVHDVIRYFAEESEFSSESELALFTKRNYMLPIQECYLEVDRFIKNIYWEDYDTIGARTNKFSKEELGIIKADRRLEYDSIYSGLVSEGKALSKWKSEMDLYKIISNIYPDALYQHRPSWLAPQSLDVFVPSTNTAIEYQGIQHYQPIDFFGGDSGYSHRVNLDERKRDLCNQKKVNLIYWRYDEPITKPSVIHRLGSIS